MNRDELSFSTSSSRLMFILMFFRDFPSRARIGDDVCTAAVVVVPVVVVAVTAIVVASVKVLMISRIFGCVVAVAEVWLLMAVATEGFVVVVVVAVVVLTSSSSTSTATSPVLASPLAVPST